MFSVHSSKVVTKKVVFFPLHVSYFICPSSLQSMLFLWLTEVHKIKVVQFLIRLITAVINLVKSVTELQINIFENYVNKFLKVP